MIHTKIGMNHADLSLYISMPETLCSGNPLQHWSGLMEPDGMAVRARARTELEFRAFRVDQSGGQLSCGFENLTLADLDEGDLTVRVMYSSVNYKDAMAARGVGRNVRTDRACVTGIDLAGVVVASRNPAFKAGDQIVATNYDLGVNHDGGYSEYACIPAEWAVQLPEGLSALEAMALGTAGLTAALAIDKFERAGLKPADGTVAVSGATGGVGSLAIDMLARRGYQVVAISRKAAQAAYLRGIGASCVIDPGTLAGKDKSLADRRWAAAIDGVGGELLEALMKHIKEQGMVAVCGMASGPRFDTTVFPFIMRALSLFGINVSGTLSMPDRIGLWSRLASDLKPQHLEDMIEVIAFDDLNQAFDRFLDSSVRGRIVVRIGE
ncbi:acryloyl-CoA reductase [Bordetella bronchiseptica]|uniref:acrylyl-CoA reductase family protein n=1 Tax=Bordetella bronchiseptica TaxID=518 RepID=UPI0018D5A6BF|nr:acryloyl-CoA reductase [Bordetella bronchiseptica]